MFLCWDKNITNDLEFEQQVISVRTILKRDHDIVLKTIERKRTIAAVSYTHLDVYKRQVKEKSIILEISLGLVTPFIHTIIWMLF